MHTRPAQLPAHAHARTRHSLISFLTFRRAGLQMRQPRHVQAGQRGQPPQDGRAGGGRGVQRGEGGPRQVFQECGEVHVTNATPPNKSEVRALPTPPKIRMKSFFFGTTGPCIYMQHARPFHRQTPPPPPPPPPPFPSEDWISVCERDVPRLPIHPFPWSGTEKWGVGGGVKDKARTRHTSPRTRTHTQSWKNEPAKIGMGGKGGVGRVRGAGGDERRTRP